MFYLRALLVPRLLGVLCALCALSCMMPSLVRAQALSALVRLAAPEDARLLARIGGQTGDLSATVRAYAAAPLEAERAERLARARALGVRENVQVVIWAERFEQALTLVVVDLRLARVLVRELPGAKSERDVSAQEEAAALVVRSALKASLAGEPLGDPAPELEVEHESALATAAPQLPAPMVAPPPRERELRGVHALLALGVLAGADGATDRGHYGALARVGLRWGRLELQLRGSLGLRAPVTLRLPGLRDAALSRHHVALALGYGVLLRSRWSLRVLGGAAQHVFVSRAHADGMRLEAQTERTWLASLDAGSTLTYAPGGPNARLGLAVSAWLQVFPRALRLGYEERTGFSRLTRTWSVQPALSLELVVRLGP